MKKNNVSVIDPQAVPTRDYDDYSEYRLEGRSALRHNEWSGKYDNNGYVPYAEGQITKFEAGVIYRNVKEGNIDALPETTSAVYQLKDLPMGTLYIRRADNDEDYKDSKFFQSITKALLSKDFKTANEAIKEWEKDQISRATSKSPFAKYK